MSWFWKICEAYTVVGKQILSENVAIVLKNRATQEFGWRRDSFLVMDERGGYSATNEIVTGFKNQMRMITKMPYYFLTQYTEYSQNNIDTASSNLDSFL